MAKLSICIPVFNQNVTALLEDLLEQREALTEDVEILVFEDGSAYRIKKYNGWLRDRKEVFYEEFQKNVGRAAIRNRLGQAASGNNLLFLDDDSRFDKPDFLKSYLQYADGETVFCGGRKYPEKKPENDYTLHWCYGSKAESKDAEGRNQTPYDAFHSNNFVVPRKVLMNHPFDESLKEYGHEDTLFGYTLSKYQIPIKHIENYVIHSQLESNIDYLEKSKKALQNLWSLYQRKDHDFNRTVKILRAYEKARRSGTLFMIGLLYRVVGFQLEQYLLYDSNPSLKAFNFFKLGYLANLKRIS